MSNLNPNKKLGQHWLRDSATLDSICDAAQVGALDTVFEIGPGLGTLTKKLAARAKQVIALEYDSRLAANLQMFEIMPNVEYIHGDILQFNLGDLPTNYKVVANLPYYITSKIVRILLESKNPPVLTTILVQKEVAERMAAQPGQLSILGVAVQYYAEARLDAVVIAAMFTPPPKVDSQVITLIRRDVPLFPDIKTEDYFRTVRAGFSAKRKKLRSSLSGGLQKDKQSIDLMLSEIGISGDLRAQDLSLEQWAKITRKVCLG